MPLANKACATYRALSPRSGLASGVDPSRRIGTQDGVTCHRRGMSVHEPTGMTSKRRPPQVAKMSLPMVHVRPRALAARYRFIWSRCLFGGSRRLFQRAGPTRHGSAGPARPQPFPAASDWRLLRASPSRWSETLVTKIERRRQVRDSVYDTTFKSEDQLSSRTLMVSTCCWKATALPPSSVHTWAIFTVACSPELLRFHR